MKKNRRDSSDSAKKKQTKNRDKAIKNVMSTFETMYNFIDLFVEQKSFEKYH